MKKLSVKDIVAFRGKSDRAQQNFVNSVKIDIKKAEIDGDGGGDYWIICISAISNSYKLSSVQPIVNKKEELEVKLETVENIATKNMYERNIKVLDNYGNFDFTTSRPQNNLVFLKKKKDDYTLIVKGIPIQVKPHYVFSFENNGVQEVGAIWFIAKLNGFKKNELGMFADILYRYLKTHFAEQCTVSSRYCIAVDVFNGIELNYSQLESGEVDKLLDLTLDSIKKLI